MTSIGELIGTVSLEDRFSNALGQVERVFDRVSDRMEGNMKTVAIAAGAVVTAVTAIASTVVYLGNKGSHLNDLENGFRRLAGGVKEADDILRAMTQGVANTVDSMDLMQFANRALSTGAIKTAQDFGTVTSAARVLSREGLGPIEGIMSSISGAMTTGRVRQLQYQIGVIDLKKAETEYAYSLGITRDELSQSGRVHAAQIAIMERLNQKIKEAGDQQKSFSERITSVRLVIGNWFDDIAKAVAKSSDVNGAFDAIGRSILENFGGDAKTFQEAIIDWINRFARAVGTYGPIVIGWLRDIFDGILKIWHAVQEAWDLVPDWFKNIARDAALAGGSVYLLSRAFQVVGGTDTLGTLANLATMISGARDATLSLTALAPGLSRIFSTIQILGFTNAIAYLLTPLSSLVLILGSKLPEALALTLAGFANLAIPIAAATAAFLAAYQAYKLWSESRERNAANTRQEAIDALNLERLNKVLGTSYVRLSEAVDEYNRRRKEQNDVFVGPKLPEGYIPPPSSNDIADRTTEIKDATKKSVEETAQLWEQYASMVKKASGDALGAALSDVDGWYETQKDALDKSKRDNVNYYNQLAALDSVYWAKRAEAFEANKLPSRQINQVSNMLPGPLTQGQYEQRIGARPLDARDFVSALGLDVPTAAAAAQKAIDKAMQASARDFGVVTAEVRRLIIRMDKVGYSAHDIAETLVISTDSVNKVLGQTWNVVSSLAEMFVRLGQAGVKSMDAIMDTAAKLLIILDSAHKFQVENKTSQWGMAFATDAEGNANKVARAAIVAQLAANIYSGAADVWAATDRRSRAARAGMGAMAGATAGGRIGSMFGPEGAAIGMAVGAVAGFFTGLIRGKPAWAKIADEVGKIFGARISESLAKEIEKSAKRDFRGSNRAAEIGHLGQIIGEAGGLTSTNLQQMTARFRDLFSMIETGQMTVAQGARVIDENFQAFAEAGTSQMGVLQASLVEIITLNDRFGTQSKAIAEYVKGQLGQAGEHVLNALTASAVRTQEQADAASSILAATIARMAQQGTPLIYAVQQMAEAIALLERQMKAAGLTGGAAFQQISDLANLAADKVSGPLLRATDEWTQALVALSNAGGLTQEMFAAVAKSVGETYEKLIAQGKSNDLIMLALQPELQRLWELEQQFGYSVDATTQALIDQAVAAGEVGDKFKSPQQQMIDALGKMNQMLALIVQKFGISLPQAIQDYIDALNRIPAPRDTAPPPPPPPTGDQTTDTVYAARGVVIPWLPRGLDTVPAMLSSGERVLTPAQNRSYEDSMLSSGYAVHVHIDARGAMFDKQGVKALSRAVREAVHENAAEQHAWRGALKVKAS